VNVLVQTKPKTLSLQFVVIEAKFGRA